MVKKIEKIIGYYGGIENKLTGLAKLILMFAIIGLIVSFVIAGNATRPSRFDGWGERGISYFWMLAGIVGLLYGILIYFVLSAGADIIRLLKKLNGIPYGGDISKASKDTNYYCSACGKLVHNESECPHCYKKFNDVSMKDGVNTS